MGAASINNLGLLEPGIHPMVLDDISEVFGRFQRSDRRMKLVDRLRAFANEVWHADSRVQILVNGSFVMTRVDEPGDVDLLLILPADWDFAAQLRPFEYNIVSKRMVKRIYGFDLLIGLEGQESAKVAIDFFAQVNVKWIPKFGIPTGTTKGLLRIEP
jgi:hypothetical protein